MNPMRDKTDALPCGTIVAKYRIERQLARGGMGEVYKADDLELQRPVALKILTRAAAAPANASSSTVHLGDIVLEARKQLLREARLACSLSHPAIVTVYSIERTEDLEFLVMEYVEGGTLQDLLRDGPFPLDKVLSIGADVADALARAHEIGLIHRDVKPGNLMMTRSGQVKVVDFGLAKFIHRARKDPSESSFLESTSPNIIKGTIPYMSPEQIRAEPLDGRSDLFSLGSVLYECATGERPFRSTELHVLLKAIANEEPTPPSQVRPELGTALDAVLAKTMAKDRAHRYGSGLELAQALRSLRQAQTSTPEPSLQTSAPVSTEVHNLPPQLTSFVGREREVDSIRRRFASSRLVTLIGAGGCGKSRLALRVAQDPLRTCSDGVWYVDLAPLSDPMRVPDEVAAVLSIREEGGKPLSETLVDHLIGKSLLLVIDNCEHVIEEAAALVSKLLYGCPGLHILTTSRRALHVPGEFVWRTPSLSFPPEGREIPWQEIGEYESIQLFLARTEAAHAEIRPNEQNLRLAAQLCRELDGIPLAIELAAGRAAALRLPEILSRLKDRFRLLGAQEYGSPRQRTLRATIDWSYDLLSEPERLLFRRLGVFAASFGLEAAESVCSSDGIEADDVLSLVVRLFDQSLVYAEEDPSGEGRYRLPETLRAYARERLRDAGEDEAVWQRHREHFLALAEQAEPELQGPDQAIWLRRLGLAYEDIRVALRSSLDRREGRIASRFCAALRRFWWVRGMWSEGRARIGEALELVTFGVGAGADQTGVVSPAIGINLLHGGAVLSRGQGAYDDAEDLLSTGLDLAKRESDMRGMAVVLFELANIKNERGDLARARPLYDQSLQCWRDLGDKRGMSAVLHNLGVIAQSQKDYRAARRLYEESLGVQRELGNRAWEASGLNGLGGVAIACSDWATARSCHAQALSIQKDLGDRWGTAFSLRGLGMVAEGVGDLKEARELLRESLRILRDLGDREGMAESLESLAGLAVADSQPERALRLAGAAHALREVIGSPLMPSDRDNLDKQLRKAKNVLGKKAALRSLADGKLLTLDQAVRYGLE